MTGLDVAERGVRILGMVVLATAWITAARGAAIGSGLPAGRAAGLARERRALRVYAFGAIPYFLACALLWIPLPVEPGDTARIAFLVVGTPIGLLGAVLYLRSRRELGVLYNVSSSLGSELYAGHRLITTGPYAWCRHPMYFGTLLAGIGGFLVYRTWTFVFVLISHIGAVIKARHEDKLLAAEFGDQWRRYARQVPSLFPRIPAKELDDVQSTTRT